MWWIVLAVAIAAYIIINIYVALDFKKFRVGHDEYNVNDYMYDKMGLFLFVGALFYFPIFIVDMVYDRKHLKELRAEYESKVARGEIDKDALKKLKEETLNRKSENKIHIDAPVVEDLDDVDDVDDFDEDEEDNSDNESTEVLNKKD